MMEDIETIPKLFEMKDGKQTRCPCPCLDNFFNMPAKTCAAYATLYYQTDNELQNLCTITKKWKKCDRFKKHIINGSIKTDWLDRRLCRIEKHLFGKNIYDHMKTVEDKVHLAKQFKGII